MNIKFLFLWFCSSFLYGSNGGFVSFQPIGTPIEFSINENGVEILGAKSIITPIGVFRIGYSSEMLNFKDNYTYVIIKNKNDNQEYTYSINSNRKLHLIHKGGTTNIYVKENFIEIIVKKGEKVKIVYDVEETLSNRNRWINPSKNLCETYGGKINNDAICTANWENANKICIASGSRLPNMSEFQYELDKCGYLFINEICLKKQGFAKDSLKSFYWTSTKSKYTFFNQKRFKVANMTGFTNYSSSQPKNKILWVKCIKK